MAPLALAYVGDTVYDLFIRTMLVENTTLTPHALHKKSSNFVCAHGQTEAFYRIESLLTEEEMSIFKRGRNAHSGTIPKNASVSDYRTATGFEALLGFLFLSKREERLQQLIKKAVENTNETGE